MSADVWVVRLPWRTPPLSMNDRLHHMARHRITKMMRTTTHQLARQIHKIPPQQRVEVALHYMPRDGRRRDEDNLGYVLKACCDGLVDAGIVPDDTPQFMVKTANTIDAPNRDDPHLYLVIRSIL